MTRANDPPPDPPEQTLRRSLGLPLLVLYGLGTTIGAGIYVLTGEVAGTVGMYAPLAFLAAALLAALSAGSFAELSARYPKSAGEAIYVQEGFARPALATAVGLLVATAGSVSAAAISNGFAGYVFELWGVPRSLALVAMIAVLTAIAAWGVAESVRIAGAVTLLEIFGLALVLWATRASWSTLPDQVPAMIPPWDLAIWGGIGSASILAFYAFLGFEDMVNVAEEVKRVGRTLPLAIGITLLVTTIAYALIATAGVLTVPPSELARSQAPLAMLYGKGGGNPQILGAIAVLAVVNGALIQIIMAARVIYGLASRGSLPKPLAHVHPRTRTPVRATVGVGAVVVTLALAFPLVELAEVTSLITLVIFALVNLALVRLHRTNPAPEGAMRVPRWTPILGAATCLAVLSARLVSLLT